MILPVPLHAVTAASSTVQHDVQDLAAEVGLSDIERKQLRDGGLIQVPVAQVDLAALVEEVLATLSPVDCRSVIFAHSLELNDTTAAHLTKMLSEALPDLDNAPLIISGRPCSIIHLGVQLAARLWRHKPDSTVLLFGGDVAANHTDRFFFGSAMGDAAVGLALGGSPTVGEILATVSTWQVLAVDGAASPAEDVARFRAQNPTAIRATIGEALAQVGLDWSDLSAIVPHTPYRAIWDTIAQLCRFPREQILDQNIGQTGHLNSNDVIVHFRTSVCDGRLRPGDVAALVSPGFGGVRGCTLVRVA